MGFRAGFYLTAVIAILLLTRDIFLYSSDAREKAKSTFDPDFGAATTTSPLRCSLSTKCPPDHFAFHIRSGAANVIGPKICFNGKNIMSHVLNNVEPGINIVVVNGENGVVEKFGYLNINAGDPEDILAYLKDIKPAAIVLVASFDDVATKLTDEMREIFVDMGSTLISSLKPRDNWVFAGRAGTKIKSLFEKHAVNNESTNVFEEWPEMVEVGGCFPRTLTEA
ncbi:protein FAM3C isoform 2-T2 [Odontesthes bonariensis]|uniref:protein FAM3C isoform X2 n=1 Tax=Odontesthes bonariensis TaxID=219752 RepID=UPI003F58A2C6